VKFFWFEKFHTKPVAKFSGLKKWLPLYFSGSAIPKSLKPHNPQPKTYNLQPTTYNPQPTTHTPKQKKPVSISLTGFL